jgi:UDP:flavonoid glycosyltransferase YjiC (YdhE family)
MGADQPWTADRCVTLGVARVLDPLTCTPRQVAAAVRALLDDDAPRRAAARLAARSAALPTTAAGTDLLERLAG